MGDEAVDVDLAFHVPVHDLRHVGAAARAAEGRALPLPARDELERAGADLGAGLGHADDDALAPALVRAFQSLAHHLGVADALERIVRTAVGQLHDGIHHVLHLVRVDEVRHPELARHLLAGGVDVHADDLVRAHHLRALDHVQADAAQTEHHHVRAGLHLGREQHRADAGGHAATDVTNLVEGRVLADLGQRDLRRHRVVAEGAGAHVVEDRLAVDAEAAGGIGHQALALRAADQLAQVGLAREAELALAALGGVERDHVVALLERGDARAHVHHHARAFMAQDGREDAFRIGAREGVVIGVADACGLDFHQHLAELRALEVHGLDGQGFAGFPGNGCFGLHGGAFKREGEEGGLPRGAACRSRTIRACPGRPGRASEKSNPAL